MAALARSCGGFPRKGIRRRSASSPRWETERGGRSSCSPSCSPASSSAGENAKVGFREDLEALCGRVDGAFAASLMGFDGIAIETAQVSAPSGIELTTVIVEYSGILAQVRQAAESLQMGKASEVSIRTEKMVAVARPLTPDYFVLLALAPEGNIGRARYELRIAAPKLVAQL